MTAHTTNWPCPAGCESGYPDPEPEMLRVNVDGEISCPLCWELFGMEHEDGSITSLWSKLERK